MACTVGTLTGAPQPLSIGGAADSTAQVPIGTRIQGVDPVWGAGEFIYLEAGTTITAYQCCNILVDWDSVRPLVYTSFAIPVLASPNLGVPVCIAMQDMSTYQFGWFCVSGMVPVACDSSAVGISISAGVASTGLLGAVVAGQQVLNLLLGKSPDTISIAKDGCYAPKGAKVINVPNAAGLFIGMPVTGTGITAGSRVRRLSYQDKSIELTLATSASVSGTLTFTGQDVANSVYYSTVYINQPFLQGAIT